MCFGFECSQCFNTLTTSVQLKNKNTWTQNKQGNNNHTTRYLKYMYETEKPAPWQMNRKVHCDSQNKIYFLRVVNMGTSSKRGSGNLF